MKDEITARLVIGWVLTTGYLLWLPGLLLLLCLLSLPLLLFL